MPRIWITYAWADNEQGDFTYLVQELREVEVEVAYDRIAIIPGRELWDQIATRITDEAIDGWGYLITPNSLSSEACREELAYALDRALQLGRNNFPLIGLVRGVGVQDVPLVLRTRLLVNLTSPDWKEEIKAGLENRPPATQPVSQSHYVYALHRAYAGNPAHIAVEVRPRFGEIMYWRFAVPTTATVVSWGHGPSHGGMISAMQTHTVPDKVGEIDGTQVRVFGAGDRLSAAVSSYVVFQGELPAFLCFGLASAPFGNPGRVERIRLR